MKLHDELNLNCCVNFNEHRKYWNIVKGLGIIAVVIGHTNAPVTKYIYMYHLALFFFVSGFLYKDKNSADPFTYFASCMRRLWWPMVKYGIVFVLLHNVFLHLNIFIVKKRFLESSALIIFMLMICYGL